MKKYFVLVIIICWFSNIFGQINIDNYRAIELRNWNGNASLNSMQINQLKAEWNSGSTINLDFDLLMNVEATDYVAIFNLRQVSTNAVEVNTLINERISTFKTALEKMKIKGKDVVVEFISQVPIYGLRTDKKLFSKGQLEVPIGFELHKNVSVIFSNYDLLNEIMTEAAKAEIYDLIKIDYIARSPHLYYDTMRQILGSYIDKIEKRYKDYGVEIDSFEVRLNEKTSVVYPLTRYTTYNGLTRLSYDHLLKKNDELSTVTTTAAPSMYYDHLPYNDFDIILHPEVVKPSIQYTLNLKLVYTPKPKQATQIVTKTETEKQFYILTPDGQVRLLDTKK
ncbi:MAG: SIMPL domain-containing protein [Flavobacteriales bacterium]|nr:SIMPL domain-containing protein [Flavobacteriales bacterium]